MLKLKLCKINSTSFILNIKQAFLSILISDYLNICDPVLTFDRLMEEIELEKYLKSIPKHLPEGSDIVVIADAKIVSQLHGGGFAGQSEQVRYKIDCISVHLASETMKTASVLQFHILFFLLRRFLLLFVLLILQSPSQGVFRFGLLLHLELLRR